MKGFEVGVCFVAGQTTCLLAAELWRTVEADEWTWLEDPKKAALSLDARGQMEGRLKAQLLKAFSITLGAFTFTRWNMHAAKPASWYVAASQMFSGGHGLLCRGG